MSKMQQTIIMDDKASKIFIFEQVHDFKAAQKKAEEKKLNAFGKMAKFNILNRPKVGTVHLVQKEVRLEPFWYIEANKVVDYDHHSIYQVDVPNAYVQSIEIEGQSYKVARNDDGASVSLSALEKCYRKIYYKTSIDGLKRYVYPDAFIKYSEKFKLNEIRAIDDSHNMIQPKLSQIEVIKQARDVLNKEIINAHEVHQNVITFDKVYLCLVPIFAFKFEWETGDEPGVIEVNGLTGKLKENGEWYDDKVTQSFTREMMIETSSNLDSELTIQDMEANKIDNNDNNNYNDNH